MCKWHCHSALLHLFFIHYQTDTYSLQDSLKNSLTFLLYEGIWRLLVLSQNFCWLSRDKLGAKYRTEKCPMLTIPYNQIQLVHSLWKCLKYFWLIRHVQCCPWECFLLDQLTKKWQDCCCHPRDSDVATAVGRGIGGATLKLPIPAIVPSSQFGSCLPSHHPFLEQEKKGAYHSLSCISWRGSSLSLPGKIKEWMRQKHGLSLLACLSC